MDQERFDELAKKVFDGASRRRVLGGALATAFGAGVAVVTGVSAKGNKGKGKSRKGKKARGEFICTAANALGACGPAACCESTPAGNGPACVGIDLQAGSQTCGEPGLGGAGVCRTCPAGTRCSGFPLFRCVCDSVSCPDGCCIDNSGVGNDQCIANGFGEPVSSINPIYDGSFVCGTRGSFCNVCSLGTLFSGCCTAGGACAAGTSNNNCGSDGKICEQCQNDSSCGEDQACTGGTTTTTTTTTTTPVPCPPDRIQCKDTCCGRKQQCVNQGQVNERCRRRRK